MLNIQLECTLSDNNSVLECLTCTLIQVKKRAADARRALDLLGLLNEGSAVGNLMGENFDFSEFKGRLDLDRAGIMGHSFGGATTIQTLREDQRFKYVCRCL